MSQSWEKFEKALADAILGELTPGSGNKSVKGDGQSARFLAEAKWRDGVTGDRHYIDLLEKWLTTVAKHAQKRDKIPVLGLCIANMMTICLIPYPVWSEHDGRLYDEDPTTIGCGGRKQIRLYADMAYGYNVFEFTEAGTWIALPKSDLRLLAKIEQEDIETTRCMKLNRGSRWRTGPKTERDLEIAAERKEQARQRRRESAKKRKLR